MVAKKTKKLRQGKTVASVKPLRNLGDISIGKNIDTASA
jgi:hypothetical protein